MDTAMVKVFKGMIKKMNDGGGVTFDIDLQTQGDEDALAASTLERWDNEEGDGDHEDKEGASESATLS